MHSTSGNNHAQEEGSSGDLTPAFRALLRREFGEEGPRSIEHRAGAPAGMLQNLLGRKRGPGVPKANRIERIKAEVFDRLGATTTTQELTEVLASDGGYTYVWGYSPDEVALVQQCRLAPPEARAHLAHFVQLLARYPVPMLPALLAQMEAMATGNGSPRRR